MEEAKEHRDKRVTEEPGAPVGAAEVRDHYHMHRLVISGEGREARDGRQSQSSRLVAVEEGEQGEGGRGPGVVGDTRNDLERAELLERGRAAVEQIATANQDAAEEAGDKPRPIVVKGRGISSALAVIVQQRDKRFVLGMLIGHMGKGSMVAVRRRPKNVV